jgi:hypothetical protein
MQFPCMNWWVSSRSTSSVNNVMSRTVTIKMLNRSVLMCDRTTTCRWDDTLNWVSVPTDGPDRYALSRRSWSVLKSCKASCRQHWCQGEIGASLEGCMSKLASGKDIMLLLLLKYVVWIVTRPMHMPPFALESSYQVLIGLTNQMKNTNNPCGCMHVVLLASCCIHRIHAFLSSCPSLVP